MKNLLKLALLISFIIYSSWASAQSVVANTNTTINLHSFLPITTLSMSIVELRQELYKELHNNYLILQQVSFSKGLVIQSNKPSYVSLLTSNYYPRLVTATMDLTTPTQSVLLVKPSLSKKEVKNKWSRLYFKNQHPDLVMEKRMPSIGIVYTF